MSARTSALAVLVAVGGACAFFADEGFPCAVDGSCPGELFCVNDRCIAEDRDGDDDDDDEGDEGEGEEGEGEEGEGEEGEGEEGEGESGFVFTSTVLSLPAANFYFGAAQGSSVVIAGWTSDALLGRPALTGEDRIFVAGAPIGGAFSMRADAVVEANRTHLDGLEIVDGGALVSGFASGFLTSNLSLGSCLLSNANRLSAFMVRVEGDGTCNVLGRVTATSATAANVVKVMPYSQSGADILFGVQLSTSVGAVFDLEEPTTASLGLTDWGTVWVSNREGSFTTGVAESFFLGASNAATGVVAGNSEMLDALPVSFRGASLSVPATVPTGIVGFADSPSRSTLFREDDGSTVAKLANIDADPVVLGTQLGGSCPGIFVSRMNATLQGAVWTAELCAGSLFSVDALVVDGDEVLVLFFATDSVTRPDGELLTTAGLVAAAFDVDTGALQAIANAFADGIGETAPSAPAFAGAASACGNDACAISAHRVR